MENITHKEGKLTKAIENQTAKIPSDAFLFTAMGAFALSMTLACMRKQHAALIVGQWIAPILIMGVYDKLVKQQGHD